MGKKKLIAETGAGQHGVALASAAALMQLECEIHMGEVDIKKEWPNVRRMQVRPCSTHKSEMLNATTLHLKITDPRS